jgi:hypothetical protein
MLLPVDPLMNRLGQKLDVNIYKLTVSGTVEDRTFIHIVQQHI